MPKTNAARKKRRPTRQTTPDAMTQMRTLLLGTSLQQVAAATDTAIATQKQRLRRQQRLLSQRIERRTKELSTRLGKLQRKVVTADTGSRRMLAALQQEHQKSIRALQQETTAAMQGLKTELAAMLHALDQRMTKAIADMQHGKTDRSALASLFEDFAQRVAGAQKKRA